MIRAIVKSHSSTHRLSIDITFTTVHNNYIMQRLTYLYYYNIQTDLNKGMCWCDRRQLCLNRRPSWPTSCRSWCPRDLERWSCSRPELAVHWQLLEPMRMGHWNATFLRKHNSAMTLINYDVRMLWWQQNLTLTLLQCFFSPRARIDRR